MIGFWMFCAARMKKKPAPGWGECSWTSSSSWTAQTAWTKSSTTVVANEGLFPLFLRHEARGPGDHTDDETVLMQLTGSERARLQEGGVPDHILDRVEHLMQTLDQHQIDGNGPESRWAI